MKRHLIVLAATAIVAAVSFVAPSSAAAQSGFMLGYTTTNLTFTPTTSTSVVTGGTIAARTPTATRGSGFLAGVALHESDRRPLEFSLEGLLTTRGTKLSGAQLRLTYIATNAFVRSGFHVAHSLTGHVYAGPEIGYLVHSSFGGVSLSTLGTSMSKSDFGLTFGGGVNWEGRVLDVRYTAGLNSLSSPGTFGLNATAKDRSIAIVFGVGR